MPDDPFRVLGLPPDASADDVHAARRRLAKEAHPDVGGDPRRMQEINVAVAAALARLEVSPEVAAPAPHAPTAPTPPTGPPPRGGRRWSRQVVHDAPSFTIEALPAEAFEALLVVTSWIGELLVDDPPYLLEAHLYEPSPTWCRLDVVPDAGASTVSITCVGPEGEPPPDVDAVRDVWVASLNQLDWGELRGPDAPRP